MTGLGWSVPASQAEPTRQELEARGAVRPGIAWLREGDRVVIPLRQRPEPPPASGQLVEREFPAPAHDPPRSYRELLRGLSTEQLAALPRAFDVIGDVVLVRLPPELAPVASEVGAALLEFVPAARIVGADEGVRGPERRRSLRRLAGSGSWATVHRENGLRLDVDLERAYFSPRLAREHELVAAAVRPHENVLDLCCGIGPFALLIAHQGRAASVTAVDQNPDAIELLQRNLSHLRPGCPVESRVSEAGAFLLESPSFDRAILNHPTGGAPLLPAVGRCVRPGGSLHYYELMERTNATELMAQRTAELGPGWVLRESREVHPYSAQLEIRCLTISRSPG
ncbi:MAG TPA: methyltransferase domain-containing protein [Thermoplasmata archaeon]|nr:methyltransferase domain-containing protein [Thermoplasmata archaeon]